MSLAREQKLGRLVDRLVAAEAGDLSRAGGEFLRELLRWRLGLRRTQPHLPSRGRPLDVMRYERGVIEQRAERALELPGVADEAEAVGAAIR